MTKELQPQINSSSLRDTAIGTCPVCREDVNFSDNFVRSGGTATHVVCLLAGPPPAAPDRRTTVRRWPRAL